MANENDRPFKKILEEYREEKAKSRHNNAYTQKNIQKALELLQEKNAKNASFEEMEQAYKDANLYNNDDLHK